MQYSRQLQPVNRMCKKKKKKIRNMKNFQISFFSLINFHSLTNLQ